MIVCQLCFKPVTTEIHLCRKCDREITDEYDRLTKEYRAFIRKQYTLEEP